MTQVIAFIMALIYTLLPFVNYGPKNDDILLNVSIISDTHLDARFPGGKLNLERGLRDMNRFDNDAVVVVGDLTNYGDEASVKYFYDIMQGTCKAEDWVVATGNHEIGHPEEFTNEEARQNFIKYHNEYTGQGIENAYYSIDVDGYTFVVLCDQSEDNWDSCDIYDDQLEFLDKELARATAEGKPAFVVCHVPVEGVNGQDVIYEDGGLDEYSDAVRTILEKYENIFFISGHVHTGINGYISEELFGISCVEEQNGVTYVNLPTYGIVNRYGIPWNGMGFQMEVYENEVVFRARKFNTSRWYGFYEFEIPLV
ncbi:MAG: metallophosphoesterase [Clostridia bacterium]|nr:metallophosphoesterase [Clostridia bacterium]